MVWFPLSTEADLAPGEETAVMLFVLDQGLRATIGYFSLCRNISENPTSASIAWLSDKVRYSTKKYIRTIGDPVLGTVAGDQGA